MIPAASGLLPAHTKRGRLNNKKGDKMSAASTRLAIEEIIRKLGEVLSSIEDDAVPVSAEVPKIPFKDNKEFSIPDEWLVEWYQRYGELFVRRELLKVRGWCLDNPAKQKFCGTKGSKPKGFIGGWLSRAAEKTGRYVSRAGDASKYARKS